MQKIQYLYLLLGIVTLGLAFFLNQTGPEGRKEAQQEKSALQEFRQELEKELERFQDARGKAVNLVQTEGRYALLDAPILKNYEAFLFKNGELIFWSDYRYVPNYEAIRGDYHFRYFDQNQGKFIFNRTNFFWENEAMELYLVLPLYREYQVENTYLQSGFNPKFINNPQLEISNNTRKNGISIYSPKSEYLFSISYPDNVYARSFKLDLLIVLFAVLGVVFIARYMRFWLSYLSTRHYYELSFLILFIFLLIVRYVALVYQFPQGLDLFSDWVLFDPRIYASSYLSPSLGDLLINLLAFGILLHYFLLYWHKAQLIRSLFVLPSPARTSLAIVLLLLAYLSINFYFGLLSTLFIHSSINLDIARDFRPGYSVFLGELVFILASVLGFFFVHILLRLIIQLRPRNNTNGWDFFLLITMVFIFFYFLMKGEYWIPIFISLGYFLLLYYWELPRGLYYYDYRSFIYLLSGAFFFSLLGAYAVYSEGGKREIREKSEFATNLLFEADHPAEDYLARGLDSLRVMSSITGIFNDSSINRREIVNGLKKEYFSHYLDKYQVDLLFFEPDSGQRIYPSYNAGQLEDDYRTYVDKFRKIYYEVDGRDGIYFISKSGVNLFRRYLAFLEIEEKEEIQGFVIVDLSQKRAEPTRVYPELLVDKNYDKALESRDYSYAVYDDDQIVYTVGDYNYTKNFPASFFESDDLYTIGLLGNQFEHIAKDDGSRRVVVSSRSYTFIDFFSSFSLFFLQLSLCIVVFIIIHSVIRRIQNVKVNFATRIQFYLNIAFFLPLFMVSVTTLSVISTTYQEDLKKNFIHKTNQLAENIIPFLERYQEEDISTDGFYRELSAISKYAEVDINVFETKGALISSSQPAIYETGILSPFINPLALSAILEEDNKQASLKESVGSLNYQTVYVPVKSYETGDLLGIIGVPFFDSQYELDQKLARVLSTIVNIFTSIFIVFIVLSYLASQILTIPLRLITQKIKKTTFYNYNEPLEWNSKDEIGLFVDEYNKMLKKLDKSKEALVRSQKESAWREIAQQVAHEIKNPLTPMKLALQHLQMRLQTQGERVKAVFGRSFDMLLTQVETLSDIATSFSSFAKMPIPISERFEISEVLKNSQSLYSNEDIDLELSIEQGKYYVRGDRRLMGRIFTNLIKNAIEAVPENRKPVIRIFLSSALEGLVLIEFRDNGAGIGKKVKEKIFMPNFSTKSTGSGIGLAVAKRGIEHAGGRIWFDTEENLGTSFFIELPLVG